MSLDNTSSTYASVSHYQEETVVAGSVNIEMSPLDNNTGNNSINDRALSDLKPDYTIRPGGKHKKKTKHQHQPEEDVYDNASTLSIRQGIKHDKKTKHHHLLEENIYEGVNILYRDVDCGSNNSNISDLKPKSTIGSSKGYRKNTRYRSSITKTNKKSSKAKFSSITKFLTLFGIVQLFIVIIYVLFSQLKFENNIVSSSLPSTMRTANDYLTSTTQNYPFSSRTTSRITPKYTPRESITHTSSTSAKITTKKTTYLSKTTTANSPSVSTKPAAEETTSSSNLTTTNASVTSDKLTPKKIDNTDTTTRKKSKKKPKKKIEITLDDYLIDSLSKRVEELGRKKETTKGTRRKKNEAKDNILGNTTTENYSGNTVTDEPQLTTDEPQLTIPPDIISGVLIAKNDQDTLEKIMKLIGNSSEEEIALSETDTKTRGLDPKIINGILRSIENERFVKNLREIISSYKKNISHLLEEEENN